MPKRLNQALPDDGSMTTYQIRATVQAKPITNKTNDIFFGGRVHFMSDMAYQGLTGSKPAAETAAKMASSSGLPSTVATPLLRLTLTDCTPATAAIAF